MITPEREAKAHADLIALLPPARTSWADPLTRGQRWALSVKLARASRRLYRTPAGTAREMLSQIVASAECEDLHRDVTGFTARRAER